MDIRGVVSVTRKSENGARAAGAVVAGVLGGVFGGCACVVVGWFCFVLCEGRGAICVCDKAGGRDGGDELGAICVCCLFLCVSALPSAAVERGVYDGWVGGGEVVSGVPVRRGVFIPVHRGCVEYTSGDLVVRFDGLNGSVVCRADVPDGVVEDDGGVSAARVIVLWFGVVGAWGGVGFAGQSVVIGAMLKGDPYSFAKLLTCCSNRRAVFIDMFNVVRAVLAEKTRVWVLRGASRGGRI